MIEPAGWSCSQTLLRFYGCLDRSDIEGMVREVHDEVVWIRHGQRIEGRDAVRGAMGGRPRERIVRHVLTNVIVHPDAADAAHATAMMLTYGAPRLPDGEVALLGPPGGLFANESRYRREGAAWRLTFIASSPVFSAAGRGS